MVHLEITANIYCKLYAAKSRLNFIVFHVLEFRMYHAVLITAKCPLVER